MTRVYKSSIQRDSALIKKDNTHRTYKHEKHIVTNSNNNDDKVCINFLRTEFPPEKHKHQ